MLYQGDVRGGPCEEGCRNYGKVGQEHRSLHSWRLVVRVPIDEAKARLRVRGRVPASSLARPYDQKGLELIPG